MPPTTPTPGLTPTQRQAVQQAVISWYRTNARDLPWRAPDTTAWGVLLSEVMSQQTQVGRVAPLWQEWINRWPTPADLAAATDDEVLRAWGSLGYPRRALRLKECAQQLATMPTFPDEVAQLVQLPGIGEYTAAAVACFHFGHNVPVVDTNVRRVAHRLVHGTFLQPTPRRSDQQLVADLLPLIDGPVFSVGLMELGALVCTARTPECERCPLQKHCAWVRLGCPEPSSAELDAAKKRVQKFAGTNRQCRGRIMAALREHNTPVALSDIAWPDSKQLHECAFSLIEDGLAHSPKQGFLLLGSA